MEDSFKEVKELPRCDYCGKNVDWHCPYIKIPIPGADYGNIFLCRIKCALDYLKGADKEAKKLVIQQLKEKFRYELKEKK